MTALHVLISTADHAQGVADAPVTLIEYGDYECPACGIAFPAVKGLQKYFGKDLRFVFRNFPLTQVHPRAESAAETAEFAGAHGRFWEMHDGLYENQGQLGEPLYSALADALKLPTDELAVALKQHRFKRRVRSDFTEGLRSGVNGTPTFFINGNRYDGSLEDLAETIESSLKTERTQAGLRSVGDARDG
jgi:protein-disulfide isomerase